MKKPTTHIPIEEITEVYEHFCSLLDYSTNSLNSILEFTVMVGYNILLPGPEYQINVANTIRSLRGSHGTTLLQVYKIRRNTWFGKIKTPIYKLLHLGFFSYVILRKNRLYY